MKQERELHNNLKQIRTRLGMSQQDLAMLAGVTRQTISGVESGQYAPSVAISLRLAKALGCQVEDLFWLTQTLPTIAAVPAQAFPTNQSLRVSVARVDGRWIAHPLIGDAAFRSEMISADGESLPPRAGDVPPRETLEVRLFEDPEKLRQTVLLAGWAPVLSLWAKAAEGWHPHLRILWISSNSTDALNSLCRGEVHIAGMHLYDPVTNEHNRPFVQQALNGQTAVLITLGVWEEGLLVQAGNPKRIETIADLAQAGISIVNREPGSGSRMLLERKLESAGVPRDTVRGFNRLAKSHREVAGAIASGTADAGISTAAIAALFGLDFIPLHQARYDLVLLQSSLEEPPVQQLLATLGNRQLLLQMETLVGYDTSQTGEVIATVKG